MLFKNFIKDVVTDFITNQSTFSIHDVTKEARKRINANSVIIDDKPVVDVPDGQTFIKTVLVEHTEVRDIIYSILPEIDMLGYVREHNGVFWEFKPANGTTVPLSTNGGSYNGVSSFAPPAAPVASTPVDSVAPAPVTPVDSTPVDSVAPAPVTPAAPVTSTQDKINVQGYFRNGKWVSGYTRAFPKVSKGGRTCPLM